VSVGIVGGGQLGRMMALAGYPLGIRCLFLDRSADTPAAQVAPSLVGELNDPLLLHELAVRSQVLSFDWENVSVEALRSATRGTGTRIAPPLRALAVAQDRLSEKRLFDRLGIPTTRHANVESRAALERAVRRIGLPGIVKTRRMGYDGKGQRVLRRAADVDAAWQALGDAPLLYEELVDFDLEVSIIGVRGRNGDIAIYPLNRNHHHAGILHITLAPWQDARLLRQATRHLRAALVHLNYVGVLTLEFFARQGRLLANEMAPRVHNSGHWTIEGAVTSQFENHLRAVTGQPLGSTATRGHSGMINLLSRMPASRPFLQRAGCHWHDYGKKARSGRKLGHVTVVTTTAADRNRQIRAIYRKIWPELTPIP
jgi:5-(carboxyamino)imidazole ribonucleotide synthase